MDLNNVGIWIVIVGMIVCALMMFESQAKALGAMRDRVERLNRQVSDFEVAHKAVLADLVDKITAAETTVAAMQTQMHQAQGRRKGELRA